MPNDAKKSIAPPIVAVAGWVLPGAGYWLIGQRLRGAVIGITIILLFVLGLFIGGIRLLEVPMYDDTGRRVMNATLVREIRLKPWSIAQILAGPISIVGGACSVAASQSEIGSAPAGAKSHVRVNEIGTLYTAVAGMLNLLAMIDATSRAAREAA